MPLNPSPNPEFSSSLPALTGNSVAHPDTWNGNYQRLLDNTVVVKAAVEANKQATDQVTGQLAQRLDGVESSSAVSVQKAQALDWMYRSNVINFEMFVKGYTLIDLVPVPIVQGVNGDDSLDVADTSGLKVGEFYVLSDPTALDADGKAAPVSALVQVQAILSGQRVRLAANMSRNWGPSAHVLRSSIKVLGASNAAAVPGDIYLTRSINIGTDQAGGAVVIRRSLSAGLARLYYRDGYQPTWKESGWSLRRTGGDIPAGFADYEYILPMRGDGGLRLDIEGEAMIIAHIVALGSMTGLGGFMNPDLRPNTPLISAPAAAATGIMERPTLALAGYSSTSGNSQAAVRFQLSTSSTFATILHDSGVLPSSLSYSLPGGILTAGATFYWRGQVQDVAGLWSDWMTVASFTTAASFVYVAAPSITGPAANAVDVPEQPTLTFSAFTVVGGTDTYKSAQVRIRAVDGTYAAPVWDSGADAVNKLSMVVPAGKLKAGLSYGLQHRQEGTTRGWSEWSAEIKITTKAQFANVIGIALLTPGGGSGTWARIDENGAAKVTDASFFSSHPVYGAIQDVTIDGQAMVKVPAFYVKSGVIAAGPNVGKRAWWVSDQPLAGYVLHPAFMEAGSPIAQFWVGKYQGTPDNTKLGSRPGVNPLGNIDMTTMRARADARNVSGVTGFALWNYHQLSAIQLLALIEMGGADSQALIGQGYVSTSFSATTDNATVAQATWRGIVGLWGNINQMVDGLQTDSASKFRIWDKLGNKTLITTGQSAPTGSYPVTFSTDSGVSHDLSLGFLPATADGTASNGSTGDDYAQLPSCSAAVGGYSTGSKCGLFNLYLSVGAAYSHAQLGSRLAKV